MPRTARPKASSAPAQIAAFQHAGMTTAIPWPADVARHDNPTTQGEIEKTFRAVLASRSLPDWERHSDVTAAARYARVMSEIAALTKVLEADGPIMTTAKGAQVAHPGISARSTLEATATNCLRQLSLFGANIDPRAMRQSSQLQARTAGVLNRAAHPLLAHDPDGLLA